MQTANEPGQRTRREIGPEVFIFSAVFLTAAALLAHAMGFANLIGTMMNTAYSLLTDTVLYILAVSVLAGAVSALFTEFGVVALLNRILSPLMGPLYDLPGAAALGVVTTYLSDNPAILPLGDDPKVRRYFRGYQLPALTNLGTSFGMGLIITSFMLGLEQTTGVSMGLSVLVGNLGAVVGSIVSTRLMILFTKRRCSHDYLDGGGPARPGERPTREIRDGGVFQRMVNALLDGGKSGVTMGIGIIPGVLIICTLVMLLTDGPSASGGYTGAAYEGVALLPKLAGAIHAVLEPMFGFTSPEAISVPVTALGSAGAALGLVPALVRRGLAGPRDIAVFTAMCMCWSGYLSTHVSMMDRLGCSELCGKAILSHTVGGIAAGVAANWLFRLFQLL